MWNCEANNDIGRTWPRISFRRKENSFRKIGNDSKAAYVSKPSKRAMHEEPLFAG